MVENMPETLAGLPNIFGGIRLFLLRRIRFSICTLFKASILPVKEKYVLSRSWCPARSPQAARWIYKYLRFGYIIILYDNFTISHWNLYQGIVSVFPDRFKQLISMDIVKCCPYSQNDDFHTLHVPTC
jgi:hypothetical protein